MKQERIVQHMDSMLDGGRVLDPRDLQNILEAVIGKPLEAVMPGVSEVIVALSENGHITERKSLNAEGNIRIWSASCVNDYRRCLVMDTPEGRYAVILHLSNEPKRWHDKMDALLRDKGVGRERNTTPGPAEEIIVCRVWPDSERVQYSRPSLSEVLKIDADENGYISSLCFSRTRSYGGYQDSPWRDSNAHIGGNGLNAWTTFFSQLKTAAYSAGTGVAFDAGVADLQGRKWEKPDRKGLETLAACEAMADEIHHVGGILPGDYAITAIGGLQKLSMEAEVKAASKAFTEIRSLLLHGNHLSRKTAYDCNDMDNFTWISGNNCITFEDQNRVIQVKLNDNGHIISATDVSEKHGVDKFLFAEDDNGFPVLLSEPDMSVESIKTWNALISDIDTVHVCIVDDIPFSPHGI